MADQEEPPDVVTEDVAEDTVADDNMEEAKETGKDGGTPDVFSDSTSDTSSICSDIVPEPEIICNGKLLVGCVAAPLFESGCMAAVVLNDPRSDHCTTCESSAGKNYVDSGYR